MGIWTPAKAARETAQAAQPTISENSAIKRLDEISEEIKEARKTHADTQALYTERQQLMNYIWS